MSKVIVEGLFGSLGSLLKNLRRKQCNVMKYSGAVLGEDRDKLFDVR